jgi:hypothetical protein
MVCINGVPLSRNVFAKFHSGLGNIPLDVDITLLLEIWIEERGMLGLSEEDLLRLKSLTQAQAVFWRGSGWLDVI